MAKLTAAICKKHIVTQLAANPLWVPMVYDGRLDYTKEDECNCDNGKKHGHPPDFGIPHSPFEHMYCYEPKTGINYRLRELDDLKLLILHIPYWKLIDKRPDWDDKTVTVWGFSCIPFDDSVQAQIYEKNGQIIDMAVGT